MIKRDKKKADFTDKIRMELLGLLDGVSDIGVFSLMRHKYKKKIETKTGLPELLINVADGFYDAYSLLQINNKELEPDRDLSKEFARKFFNSLLVGSDFDNILIDFKLQVLNRILDAFEDSYDCESNCRDTFNCIHHPNAFSVLDFLRNLVEFLEEIDEHDEECISSHIMDISNNIFILKNLLNDQLFDELSYYDNDYFSYPLVGAIQVTEYCILDKHDGLGFVDTIVKTLIGHPEIEPETYLETIRDVERLFFNSILGIEEEKETVFESETEKTEYIAKMNKLLKVDDSKNE